MLRIGYASSAPDEGSLSAEADPSPVTTALCAFVPPSPTRGEGRKRAISTKKAQGHQSRRHGNRREVHEPALRLHKALDLRAHGARRDVMGDVEERRVIDRGRMQFGQRRVACGGI